MIPRKYINIVAVAVSVAGLTLSYSILKNSWMDFNRFNPTVNLNTDMMSVSIHRLSAVNSTDSDIDNLFAVLVTVDNTRGMFILDTGASETIVSHRFARRLNVETIEPIKISGNIDKSVVPTIRIGSFKIGDLEYRDFDMIILDIDHIQEWTHTSVDGIIGLNILNKLPFCMDFAGKELVFYRKMPGNFMSNSIKYDIEEGHIWVRPELNGYVVGKFILDTGAGSSSMSEEKLDLLFSRPPEIKSIESMNVNINRQARQVRRFVELDTIKLSGGKRDNFPIRLDELHLFGQDFLENYKVYIDPDSRLLSIN